MPVKHKHESSPAARTLETPVERGVKSTAKPLTQPPSESGTQASKETQGDDVINVRGFGNGRARVVASGDGAESALAK